VLLSDQLEDEEAQDAVPAPSHHGQRHVDDQHGQNKVVPAPPHYPYGLGKHTADCGCQGGAGPREPVLLNVYDLFWTNGLTSKVAGLGFFHSGVQIYGREWSYGQHDEPGATGIYHHNPRRAGELGRKFRFRTALVVGETDFLEKDMPDVIDMLAKDFPGRAYDLIEKNCNCFTDSLCKLLTGEGIPGWVNRPANVVQV